ncbi:MAG: hypothetical protein CMJ83_00730 [Planctomycetes bacterium]|nr:hypothetical protein [Planctomycetota bacterium]
MAGSIVRMLRILAVAVAFLASTLPAQPAGKSQWIWGHWAEGKDRPGNESCLFRATFELGKGPQSATLRLSCDNRFEAWINGQRIGAGDSWQRGARFDVRARLREGKNVVAIRARNDSGPAGLIAWLQAQVPGSGRVRIESGASWKTAKDATPDWTKTDFDDSGWRAAKAFGLMGTAPWGRVGFGAPQAPARPQDFAPLPGFLVQEVASGVGSLINLCLDDRGRPIVSVERGAVLRLLDNDGDGKYESHETFCSLVKSCQGLLYSRGGLYAVGAGPKGTGLYRIEESSRNEARLIGGFSGGMGEHGPHAVIEGPDDRLYIVIGNHTKMKAKWSERSPLKIYYEGHLVDRYLDPRGHARNIKVPGGVVLSIDREGKDWQVVAGGFRNAFDIAFNRHGQLFAYDSDMEWDIGQPWYRPTRLYHVVPGADFGWRTGSAKWSEIYPDALPPAIDCGRGSPTGIVLYDGKTFPKRFQGTILGADWAQGRILAFHLEADGATYRGRTEVLLSGRPLNVTDLIVERSGGLLFTCGGRGTRGGVYRLSYSGEVAEMPIRPRPRLRRFDDASPLEEIAEALGSEDRFTRYLAAREVERRPGVRPDVEGPLASSELLLALTRRGDDPLPVGLLTVMLADAPTPAIRNNILRCLELAVMKARAVDPAVGEAVLHLFPSSDRAANRELALLLGRMAPKGAVGELLDQLEKEKSGLEQIHLAYCLRLLKAGWTRSDKARIFRWVVKAETWSGGASFPGYVKYLRTDFEKLLSDDDRAAMKELLAIKPGAGRVHLAAGAPMRDFNRTLDFLRNSLGTERRSIHEGARVFQESCALCHKLGAHGMGAVGPEITTASARYTLEDLLTTVVDPSREISDQYRALDVFTKDDDIFTGLPVSETEKALVLMQGTGEKVEIPVAQIDSRRFAKTSGMPEGLLNALSLEEIADLFYYVRKGESETPPKQSVWRPLFNGKDLDGWDGKPGLWKVENGTIVGEMKGGATNTFLISEETFGDFVVQYEMLLEEGNSGLQFRSQRLPNHIMSGYQSDAGAQFWGSLHEEKGRGMLSQAPKVNWGPAFDRFGWNHFVVECQGDRIRITMNGIPTVVLRDSKSLEGLFGFQLHAGRRTAVRLRNVMIRRP